MGVLYFGRKEQGGGLNSRRRNNISQVVVTSVKTGLVPRPKRTGTGGRRRRKKVAKKRGLHLANLPLLTGTPEQKNGQRGGRLGCPRLGGAGEKSRTARGDFF